MSFVYSAARVLAGPVVRAAWRLRVQGLEHLPDGPVILAANHLSVSDHLFLPAVCPRKVFFMAKAEYFAGRGLRGWVTARFMIAVGQVPVQRSSARAALAALEQAEALLRQGKIFGIFPEGTRSPDGRLYRGRTGVARLALATGAPVVPVGLVGTDRVQPAGRPLPRLGPEVRISIGDPVDLSRLPRQRPTQATLRSVTDEIMARIAVLSGQELVDTYAPIGSARRPRPDGD